VKTALALAKIRLAQIKSYAIRFLGGWDQVTPPLFLKSGFLRESQNYEANIIGGYGRIKGYERFDGRPSPSAATYTVLPCTSITGGAVGDTLTGAGGATGVIIAVTATYFVLTKRNGTAYVAGENLNVGGPTIAVATTAGTVNGASTVLLHAQYNNLAADVYRDDIAAPTGSGSNLGGVRFGGVTYTFRNNAGATAVDVWKSSTAGWVQVTLYNEISFTIGGATEPAEGEVLTQGAVTATVKRVVATTASSTWATTTAAGRLIITNPAGGNFAAGAATFSGGATCTLSAIQTAITLLPGGRYEFLVDNFGGSVATKRIYGCDGVNRGFEFDGTILVPITTGMTVDTPNHVWTHKKHLFFSFDESVQHAGPGTPYIWSAILGAAELAMSDTVTGFMSQAGSETASALAIFTRNQTSILYGTGVADWELIEYRKELGAYAYTIQDMGTTMFLDDQGITTLVAAQTYGNFAHNAISAKIRTWLNSNRSLAVASCISRDKSQYRLFFSDGSAAFVTFVGGKVVGIMPMIFVDAVTWAYSSEEPDGSETIFFGSDDGMVYQMEKGTSFDGDNIAHYFRLAWDFLGSPGVIKRFYDVILEIAGTGYGAFKFSYALGYNSTDIGQPDMQDGTANFSAGAWDEAGLVWDVGVWDAQVLSPSTFDCPGEAENISLIISGDSDYDEALNFSGAIIHYSERRLQRGA